MGDGDVDDCKMEWRWLSTSARKNVLDDDITITLIDGGQPLYLNFGRVAVSCKQRVASLSFVWCCGCYARPPTKTPSTLRHIQHQSSNQSHTHSKRAAAVAHAEKHTLHCVLCVFTLYAPPVRNRQREARASPAVKISIKKRHPVKMVACLFSLRR